MAVTTMVRLTLKGTQNATGLLKVQSNGGLGIVRGFKNGYANWNDKIRSLAKNSRDWSLLTKLTAGRTMRSPVTVGQGVVMGAAGLGLGALAYYGPGYSTRYSFKWADYVSERIHLTYAYFAGVFVVAAATVAVILRSAALTNVIKRNPWAVAFGAYLILIGAKPAVRSIPPQYRIDSSLTVWLVSSCILGVAPAVLNIKLGPQWLRLFIVSTGMAIGVSIIGMHSPNDKFLRVAGPLGMGFGAIFAVPLASALVPPVAGCVWFPAYAWVVLLLESGYLVYDIYRIIKRAEGIPPWYLYDPVYQSF